MTVTLLHVSILGVVPDGTYEVCSKTTGQPAAGLFVLCFYCLDACWYQVIHFSVMYMGCILECVFVSECVLRLVYSCVQHRQQQCREVDSECLVEDVWYRRAHGPQHWQASERAGQHAHLFDR